MPLQAVNAHMVGVRLVLAVHNRTEAHADATKAVFVGCPTGAHVSAIAPDRKM